MQNDQFIAKMTNYNDHINMFTDELAFDIFKIEDETSLFRVAIVDLTEKEPMWKLKTNLPTKRMDAFMQAFYEKFDIENVETINFTF